MREGDAVSSDFARIELTIEDLFARLAAEREEGFREGRCVGRLEGAEEERERAAAYRVFQNLV